MMSITMLGFSFLLVVVPACSGAYMVARYFGSSKTSGGIYLLVFAIVACTVIVLFPDPRLGDDSDHSFAVPALLGMSFIVGVVLGTLARSRADKS